MELVTIKTFDNPIDAHLLKTQFESEGIECFLFDENIVSLNMFYNITVGGIKLKIYKSDIDKAIGILALNNNLALTDENDQPLLCPKCGSPKLYTSYSNQRKKRGGAFSIIKSVLEALFGVVEQNVYHCKRCGEEFPLE